VAMETGRVDRLRGSDGRGMDERGEIPGVMVLMSLDLR
jgi:hypothetical protein